MFPDNKIAKSFQLSKTKWGYIINYGLAPYFKELVTNAVWASPLFVLSFDESLNNMPQEEQRDSQVQYWDSNEKEVSMWYLNSHFLKHLNAKNLLDAVLLSLKGLMSENLVKLSMDGKF